MRRTALAVFSILLVLSLAGRASGAVWVVGYHNEAFVEDGLMKGGVLYLIGDSGNDTVLLSVLPNGTVLRIVRYSFPIKPASAQTLALAGDGLFVAGYLDYIPNETAFIMKVNATGVPVWARTLNSSGGIAPVKALSLSDGRVALVSTFPHGIGYAALVTVLDPNGSILWSRAYYVNGNASTHPYDAVLGPDGEIVIAGAVSGPEPQKDEVFLIAVNENGSVLWERFFGSNAWGSNPIDRLIPGPDGYYLEFFCAGNKFFIVKLDRGGGVLGYFAGRLQLNETVFLGGLAPLPSGGVVIAGSSYTDPAVVVFSENLSPLWAGYMPDSPGSIYVSAVFSAGGNLLMAGNSLSDWFSAIVINGSCLSEPCLPFHPVNVTALNATFEPVNLTLLTYPVRVTSEELGVKYETEAVSTAPAYGTAPLLVRSNPSNTTVIVDSVSAGRTPLEVSLFSGKHRVEVRKEGYFTEAREVAVAAGKTSVVEFNLTPVPARINVTSNPEGALVLVNGTEEGKTPTVLYLKPGGYTLTLKLANYTTYERKILAVPNGSLSIAVTLAPLNATLILSSSPANATVYVDGRPAGITPLNLSLKPGNYSVVLGLRDYQELAMTLRLKPNETVRKSVTLEPLNATLVLNSTPAGADFRVLMGGEVVKTGKTPTKLSLRPGTYEVAITGNGTENSTSVTLKPNETLSLTLRIPVRISTAPTSSSGFPLWATALIGLAVLGGAAAYVLRGKRTGNEPETKEGEGFIEVRAGRAFGISHVGARDNNEDNLLVMKLSNAYLLAVADGLGGHNAGEVASKIAVDTLREVFEREYRKGMGEEDVKKLLEKAHRLAHERILENATGDRKGMGTTLVSAFVRDGKIIVANTGDSRAWLIRDGKTVERTKDHSLVQELLDKGEITPEEAKRHPMKNIITKALGVDFGVDTYRWELKEGDTLLLSSDGLHDYVDEGKIVEIASTGKTAEEIARRLIDEALPVTKDNVTVVVWR